MPNKISRNVCQSRHLVMAALQFHLGAFHTHMIGWSYAKAGKLCIGQSHTCAVMESCLGAARPRGLWSWFFKRMRTFFLALSICQPQPSKCWLKSCSGAAGPGGWCSGLKKICTAIVWAMFDGRPWLLFTAIASGCFCSPVIAVHYT